MNCDACAKMIELDLEDVGIEAKCSYSNSSLEVGIDNEKTECKVKEIIVNSGYNLTSLTH